MSWVIRVAAILVALIGLGAIRDLFGELTAMIVECGVVAIGVVTVMEEIAHRLGHRNRSHT